MGSAVTRCRLRTPEAGGTTSFHMLLLDTQAKTRRLPPDAGLRAPGVLQITANTLDGAVASEE